ncbi:hypothetical protein TRFO_26974 [Tritrichomonas foetus]|uniref:Ubiquitin-like domain-containing protein n=1 Tax=Tritrichomonas foetus TaxID=1144522 RepID=A0A1J4K1M2_9EUKA|nr:hypothetical protein TRFO_26974 [Tritrichomonas foetus]|eukprot:OHT05287.1 hypothetical protein TRFO_26974 [Tritrichomonas foetus]
MKYYKVTFSCEGKDTQLDVRNDQTLSDVCEILEKKFDHEITIDSFYINVGKKSKILNMNDSVFDYKNHKIFYDTKVEKSWIDILILKFILFITFLKNTFDFSRFFTIHEPEIKEDSHQLQIEDKKNITNSVSKTTIPKSNQNKKHSFKQSSIKLQTYPVSQETDVRPQQKVFPKNSSYSHRPQRTQFQPPNNVLIFKLPFSDFHREIEIPNNIKTFGELQKFIKFPIRNAKFYANGKEISNFSPISNFTDHCTIDIKYEFTTSKRITVSFHLNSNEQEFKIIPGNTSLTEIQNLLIDKFNIKNFMTNCIEFSFWNTPFPISDKITDDTKMSIFPFARDQITPINVTIHYDQSFNLFIQGQNLTIRYKKGLRIQNLRKFIYAVYHIQQFTLLDQKKQIINNDNIIVSSGDYFVVDIPVKVTFISNTNDVVDLNISEYQNLDDILTLFKNSESSKIELWDKNQHLISDIYSLRSANTVYIVYYYRIHYQIADNNKQFHIDLPSTDTVNDFRSKISVNHSMKESLFEILLNSSLVSNDIPIYFLFKQLDNQTLLIKKKKIQKPVLQKIPSNSKYINVPKTIENHDPPQINPNKSKSSSRKYKPQLSRVLSNPPVDNFYHQVNHPNQQVNQSYHPINLTIPQTQNDEPQNNNSRTSKVSPLKQKSPSQSTRPSPTKAIIHPNTLQNSGKDDKNNDDKIKVKSYKFIIMGKEEVTLTLPIGSTILDVKHKIQEIKNLSCENLSIALSGKELKNRVVLDKIDITERTKFHVFIKTVEEVLLLSKK